MKYKKIIPLSLFAVFFLGVIFTMPVFSADVTITFPNPLKFETVQGVLGSLLNALQGIIVTISIIFIIIGAVLYITSGGKEEQVTKAKKAIFASMIGLAIGIAAPTFLREIGDVLGWGDVKACDYNGSGSIDPGDEQICYDKYTSTPSTAQIALNVLKFLLSVVGTLALIMLIVGSIMYLTAAGNEDQIGLGKKIVKFSVIGIAIAFAAMVIVTQIAKFFT